MSSQPKVNLRQVTSRIELKDYAKILQQVYGLKLYKDVSSCVRYCIQFALSNVVLDEERIEWMNAQLNKNIQKRSRGNNSVAARLRKIFSKIF